MRRLLITPRKSWEERITSIGFRFFEDKDNPKDKPYWYESACYELTTPEVDRIEEATETLHHMAYHSTAKVVMDDKLLAAFVPDERFRRFIRDSWEMQPESLVTRMDLVCDDHGRKIKLLEINADTPMSAIETALVQWDWLQQYDPKIAKACGQFNSLHEKLLEKFKKLAVKLNGQPMYFSSVKDTLEDYSQVEYYRDVATQAGIDARFLAVENIGWNDKAREFRDMDERPVRFWYKLYPWDWLFHQPFGEHLPKVLADMGMIEPPWRYIMNHKRLLAVMWDIYKGHPLLLPTYTEEGKLTDYVKKPVLGRVGQNITIPELGLESKGEYAEGEYIWQKRVDLPQHDASYTQVGSWTVDGQSAGILIREADSPLLTDNSRVVPHYFVDDGDGA